MGNIGSDESKKIIDDIKSGESKFDDNKSNNVLHEGYLFKYPGRLQLQRLLRRIVLIKDNNEHKLLTFKTNKNENAEEIMILTGLKHENIILKNIDKSKDYKLTIKLNDNKSEFYSDNKNILNIWHDKIKYNCCNCCGNNNKINSNNNNNEIKSDNNGLPLKLINWERNDVELWLKTLPKGLKSKLKNFSNNFKGNIDGYALMNLNKSQLSKVLPNKILQKKFVKELSKYGFKIKKNNKQDGYLSKYISQWTKKDVSKWIDSLPNKYHDIKSIIIDDYKLTGKKLIKISQNDDLWEMVIPNDLIRKDITNKINELKKIEDKNVKTVKDKSERDQINEILKTKY